MDNCNAIIQTATNTLAIGCKGTLIPNSVISIDDKAFKKCFSNNSGITSFSIPEGVTSIGNAAFSNCSDLEEITLPNTLTTIGNYAFEQTGLISAIIPQGVITIGYDAFYYCKSLVSIVLPESIKEIGFSAFAYCTNLTDVYCYATELPTTGSDVFRNINLSKVTLHVPSAVMESYASTEPWSQFGTIEPLVKEINGLYYYLNRGTQTAEIVKNPNGRYAGEVIIPSNFVYKDIVYNVTSIHETAFALSDITFISIPNTVTQIGMRAFYKCIKLKEIVIPNSVTTTGYSICEECTNLSSVSIGDGLTVISNGAFRKCDNLVSVSLGNNITTIEGYAFRYCTKLLNISLPKNLTFIGKVAFGNTCLSEVCCYAKEVPVIEENAFSYTDISNTTLYVPYASLNSYVSDKVWGSFGKIDHIKTKIGNLYYGLDEDEKTAIVVSSPDTYTGEIVIPEYLSYAESTFTISAVDANAFKGCSDITSVSILSTDTQISEGTFKDCDHIEALNLNTRVVKNWFADSKATIQNVTIGDDVEVIGDAAFYNYTALSGIIIPNNVTSIGYNAFSGCTSMKTVELHCNDIGSWFKESNITDLIVGREVATIGIEAFMGCTNLQNLQLNDGLVTIKQRAFKDCANLNEISIPHSVTSIGEQCYEGCTNVKTIVIGDELSEIGGQAFANCRKLENVYCYAVRYPIAPADAFMNSYVEYVILHVPEESLEQYGCVIPWMNFKEIVPLTDSDPKPTSISQVLSSESNASVANCFRFDGIQIKEPQRGLNIIRMSNGTTKKIVVK